MNHKYIIQIGTCLLIAALFFSCSTTKTNLSEKLLLSQHWCVQQSSKITQPGSIISGVTADTANWYKTSVPATVMGVLTENGLYPNIFQGDTLQQADRTPFEKPWWYRTTFSLPKLQVGQHVLLNFDGISYYANIWLNGKLLASSDSIFGMFRTFSFDITNRIKDSINILAVEIFKQKKGDYGLGFVDWNPAPPDNNMGLWRNVSIILTGDVAIRHPWVRTDNLSRNLDEASLSVLTELVNQSNHEVSGNLVGKCEDFSFSVPVELKAGETRSITLGPDQVKALHVLRPKVWWCNTMGDPHLYHLRLEFVTKHAISDKQEIPFGIRTVETYLNPSGQRGYRLNGRDVLIKGAGWTDDVFLHETPESNRVQAEYAKQMNLNTIRFEGFWGTSQNIYDLCDQYGLLVMVGWSCQWEWDEYLGKPCDEFGGVRSDSDMSLLVKSLADQIRYLQYHPSIFVWMVGSDKLPRPALEQRYKNLIASIDNRPYLGAASMKKSSVSGSTGVKMNGPYDYVGPSYWYIDSLNGGAFGFNTETGPGPQIPVKESVLKMLPANRLWPINASWDEHCNPSKEAFNNLNIFDKVLQQRYGWPSDLDNYLHKADLQSYEAMRAMYEAFRVNRPKATGIIQWMLNSAWPSFYWQLYDYYLQPTAAYFATRKANSPLQLIYDYGDNELYVVNSTLQRYEKLKVKIIETDLNGKKLLSEELITPVDANGPRKIFTLPPVTGISFLSLTLTNDQDEPMADNFYWLAPGNDQYDWDKTTWFYTPMKTSVDFKPLAYMSQVNVDMQVAGKLRNGADVFDVTLKNETDKPAFFMRLSLRDQSGNLLFPVYWDDNYISLLPGQTRTVRCTVQPTNPLAGEVTCTVSGWNVREQEIKITL